MRQKILVPKYVQYIMLPVGLFLAIWFATTVLKVLIMFLLAAIIAFVLDLPVSQMQKRLHIPRIVGVLIIWLLILGIVAGAIALLVPKMIDELNTLINSIPEYATQSQGIVENIQKWFAELDFAYKPDITSQDVVSRIESGGTEVATRLLGFAQTLFNIGLDSFLVLIISIYMLIDFNRLKETARNRVPEKFRDDAIRLFGYMQTALGHYLRGQLLVSTVMGILGGIIAWYGGAGQYVVLIAVWVALTEVIPLIGPFIGALPAVILAYFAVSPTRALIVALLFVGVQQIEGHILVPRVMGKSVGVHPLWVMFAVLSGASLAGIMGGLLAVPSVAIIKVIVDFYRNELVMERWDRPLLEKTLVEEGE